MADRKPVPGPFRLGKYGFVVEMKCPGPLPGQEDRYLPHAVHADEWMVEQLNRASHFDALVDTLQKISRHPDNGGTVRACRQMALPLSPSDIEAGA